MSQLRLFIALLFILPISEIFSQSPSGINYQAIARDNLGNEIINDDFEVRFEIRENTFQGDTVYQEDHETSSNEFGLFNLVIGTGTPTIGDFQSINWSNGTFFIATFIDDGAGFEEISIVQLLSVPYALHANTVSNADDADADPTNEHNLAFEFDSLTNNLNLTDLGGQLAVELDPIIHWQKNEDGELYQMGSTVVGLGGNNEDPSSTLDINGSIAYQTDILLTGSELVLNSLESHWLINNTGPFTIKLPNASDCTGREYVFVFKNVVNHNIVFETTDTSLIQNMDVFNVPQVSARQVYVLVSFGIEGWYFKQGL